MSQETHPLLLLFDAVSGDTDDDWEDLQNLFLQIGARLVDKKIMIFEEVIDKLKERAAENNSTTKSHD